MSKPSGSRRPSTAQSNSRHDTKVKGSKKDNSTSSRTVFGDIPRLAVVGDGMDTDDDEMLLADHGNQPNLGRNTTQYSDSGSEEGDRDSLSGKVASKAKKHLKAGAMSLLGTMVILGSIGGEVIETVKLNSVTHNAHEAGMREQMFVQKENILRQLNLNEAAQRKRLMHFVYGIGILDFTSHGSRKNDYASVT